MTQLPVLIRPAQDTDRSYILKSWLLSWRKEEVNKHYTNAEYFAKTHLVFSTLLDHAKVVVLCTEQLNDQILGFAVYDEDRLYWLQIKQIFQHLGLGKRLLAEVVGWRTEPLKCPYVRAQSRKYLIKYNLKEEV